MSLDVNNLSGSKETLRLLDFAKAVTENIKCALQRTNKPKKKKANHRSYIQRKCFTKSGVKRKSNKRGNKTTIYDDTSLTLLKNDRPISVDNNFQAKLEPESDRLCMSYLRMKDNNVMENYSFDDYLFQHESCFQVNDQCDYASSNPTQMTVSPSWSSWQGHCGTQYPPKLKHMDFEQILMNQERQRTAWNHSSFLAALQDERVVYDCTHSTLQGMYTDSTLCNGYASREVPDVSLLNTALLPH